MKKLIRNIFHLRKDMGISFYMADFFHRRILRKNIETKWAIHHTSTVICPDRIVKGINVFPGDSPGNYIEASNGIEIGDYTNIGPNVGIISANHDLVDNSKVTSAPPIKIGPFSWIGMNAVILPGVELGRFTIVGAGAVVAGSFPEGFCVLAGNPAKVIRQLDKEACLQFSKTKYKA